MYKAKATTEFNILDLKLNKTNKTHDFDKNDELLKSLESTIGTVKPKMKDRDENGEEASLFYNNQKSSEKISMDQLLASMDDKTLKKFKNIKKSMDNYQACVVPENREKVEKRTRQQAYKTNVKDMNKWDHVIHQYRDAKKLKFDNTHQIQLEPLLDDWIDDGNKNTNGSSELLETMDDNKIMDILGKLTNRERKTLHKLQLEKALEKRNQLRKLRLFETNVNVKNRYIRQIKSKTFRRRLRLLKKKREANDIGETQAQMDNVRATERALLKHRKNSRWEKRMKTLSQKLPDAKEALIQLQETSKKLINETKGVSSSDDDDHLTTTNNDQHHQLTNQQKLNLVNNPWLTDEVKKDQVYEISEDDNDPISRFKTLVPIQRGGGNHSDEDLMHDEEEIDRDSKQLFTESEEESDDEEFQTETPLDNLDEESKMRDIVDAFGDNVIGREFANDVQSHQKRLKDQILSQTSNPTKTLPGWGSWVVTEQPTSTTTSSAASRRKKRKNNKNTPKKDLVAPLVIRNNTTNSAFDNIKVRKIPRGFANDKHIFNSSIRQPIGQLFNTPKTFKHMIEPKIQTKAGVIIEPLELEAKGQNISKVKAILRDMPKDVQNKLKSIL